MNDFTDSAKTNPIKPNQTQFQKGYLTALRRAFYRRLDGSSKYSNINLVTSRFSKLMKKAGIRTPKGTGFYTLRRTAATIAAISGDPFAVQRLLGHVDLKMATRYVQDVSKQTDRVIENSREYVMQGKT